MNACTNEHSGMTPRPEARTWSSASRTRLGPDALALLAGVHLGVDQLEVARRSPSSPA